MKPVITSVESCDIVRVIEENAVASLEAWEPWSAMTFERHDDHLRTRCAIPFPFFNTISAMQFDGCESERVTDCMAWVKEHDASMSWWLGARTNTPAMNQALMDAGCFKAGENTALAMNLEDMQWDGTLPDGLTMVEVEFPEQMHIWSQVMAPPHEIPAPVIEPWADMFIASGYGVNSAGWRHFIAYIDEHPVGTTSLFTGAGVATIANVAVDKLHQKRGIGRAISAWTFALTMETGYRVGVVNGSPAGDPVYKSLGFKEYSRSAVYLWLPK